MSESSFRMGCINGRSLPQEKRLERHRSYAERGSWAVLRNRQINRRRRARTVDMEAQGEPQEPGRRTSPCVSRETNGRPLPLQDLLQQILPMDRRLPQREHVPVQGAGVLEGLPLLRDDSQDHVLPGRILPAEPQQAGASRTKKNVA